MTDKNVIATIDGLLYYDGTCAFCCRSINRVRPILTKRRVATIPFDNGAAEPEMRLCWHDGREFGGAEANDVVTGADDEALAALDHGDSSAGRGQVERNGFGGIGDGAPFQRFVGGDGIQGHSVGGKDETSHRSGVILDVYGRGFGLIEIDQGD